MYFYCVYACAVAIEAAARLMSINARGNVKKIRIFFNGYDLAADIREWVVLCPDGVEWAMFTSWQNAMDWLTGNGIL